MVAGVERKADVAQPVFYLLLREGQRFQPYGVAIRADLDALEPALEALKAAISNGSSTREALDAAVEAAGKGVEYTKTIIATKGRASYLGERSIGHEDPGAMSSYVILQTIANEF